jgi:hypothetical protein
MYRSVYSWPRHYLGFAPRSLYPPGKSRQYSLNTRLGGAQNRCGWCGEETNLTPTGIRSLDPSAVQPLASNYTDCAVNVIILNFGRWPVRISAWGLDIVNKYSSLFSSVRSGECWDSTSIRPWRLPLRSPPAHYNPSSYRKTLCSLRYWQHR